MKKISECYNKFDDIKFDKKGSFSQSKGIVEIDCGRELHIRYIKPYDEIELGFCQTSTLFKRRIQ